LFMSHRRNGFEDQWHCCVFENASGISACVADDDSTGNIRCLCVNARQFHRCRVRERFMTVVTLDKNWSIARDWVDERFSWKPLVRPFGFVPAATDNPFGLRRLFYLSCDSFRKFLRRCCVSKLNLIQLCTALNKMNVRVVKSG